jgi:CheY-like chemotaxis protein
MPQPGTTIPLLLLAEDSEDDAFFFQRVTKRTCVPVKITHVINGLLAIEALKHADRPDLVVLDLKMPEVDGFEVLSWIQNHPELSGINVVVLSGSEATADIQRAKSLGARACFTKPITVAQLNALFLSCGFSANETTERQHSSGDDQSASAA